ELKAARLADKKVGVQAVGSSCSGDGMWVALGGRVRVRRAEYFMRAVRDRFSACTTTTPDVSCTSVTPRIAVDGRADIEYRRSDPNGAVGAADPRPERAHNNA